MRKDVHQRILRMVKDNSLLITDERLFTSPAYAQYLTDTANGILRHFDNKLYVRVRVIFDPNGTSCTSGFDITINVGAPYIRGTRAEKHMIIKAALLHEVAHILYTPIALMNEMRMDYLKRGVMQVKKDGLSTEEEDILQEYTEYMKSIQNEAIREVLINEFGDVSNIVDDGYIEERARNDFPGYDANIEALQETFYDDRPDFDEFNKEDPDVKEEIQNTFGDRYYNAYMALRRIKWIMLHYARFAEYFLEDWEISRCPEATHFSVNMAEYVDLCMVTHDAKERLRWELYLTALLFPYIKEIGDALIEKYGNSPIPPMPEGMPKMAGATTAPTAATPSVMVGSKDDEEGTGSSTSTATAPSSMPDGSDEEPDDEEDAPEGGCSGADGDDKFEAEEEPSEEGSFGTGSAEPSDTEEVEGGSSFEESEEGKEGEEKEAEASASEGEVRPFPRRTPFSKRKKDKKVTADELEKILNDIATEDAYKEDEKTLLDDLNEFGSAVNHQGIHDGIDCEVTRSIEIDEDLFSEYERVRPQIEELSKKLQSNFSKILEKRRKGGKMSNLMFGRTFEPRQYIRGDGRAFSKKKLPTDKPRLAVCHDLDESGSMYGKRIEVAKATELILYDFCKAMKIPHACYGQRTDNGTVILDSYAEFDSIDNNDQFRIMGIHADGENRDGYALRFCCERLMQQNADIRLMIVTSDGRPSHYSCSKAYSGKEAEEDVSAIVQEYSRKGIKFVAAAIGEDRKVIEQMYGAENFLNIEDINSLPTELVTIIKKLLRL